MNSLPYISHHLFAAAVSAEPPARRRPARPASSPRTLSGIATAIPLELLSLVEAAPPLAARPLRTVTGAGR